MSSTTNHNTRPKVTSQPVENTVFHGDGREPALLKHLQSRRSELQGSSDAVLEAIDLYGENSYLMNVGKHKGSEVEKVIAEARPAKVLELGTYVGYSSLRFARHVKSAFPDAVTPDKWATAGDKQKAGYICLEYNQDYADVARGVLDIGGVGEFAKIIVGASSDSIKNLREIVGLGPNEIFDFLFLDHLKPLYTPDLQAMEQLGLVGPGTTIVADNVIKPGNPPYLKYVRGSLADRKAWFSEKGGEWEGKGVPELKYESRLFKSWDPYTAEEDAVEITVCKGLEQ
nr:O-methyl transferase [Phaffia rhodozyma]WEV88680.1 O-methyl transferase [Phaffia rhodozyma]WEY36547.1 O-methyl transferase [Phaffia rhodozyma]